MADYYDKESLEAQGSLDDIIQAGFTEEGWYFWDETQTQCYGPYESEELANINAAKYGESL